MKKISGIFILIFLLAACGQTNENQEQSGDNSDSPEPIEVEIDMENEAEAEEEIKIGAHVTQGEETVTDANEVLFEIWKEGEKEDSEEIMAEEPANNTYFIKQSFEEDGIYHVTAHVTARGMHSMPTEEITVGEAEQEESKAEEDSEDIHAGHQHGSPVTADLQSPSEIKAGEETELSFQIAEEGEPINEARVRLEIWQRGDDTREWVDTEEKNGMYAASHTFENSGDYMVTVHIEDQEDLHEHVDKIISVK
ncbi:FixH family protein [Alteribacillus sp. JSM 102045]|uniref:FixH family protein n=1 Tax=Alteribacillus sp. JSM 102045 TaxID=1562101 RepID=UPI0035C257E9